MSKSLAIHEMEYLWNSLSLKALAADRNQAFAGHALFAANPQYQNAARKSYGTGPTTAEDIATLGGKMKPNGTADGNRISQREIEK
jgi:hypothetical protein